MSKLPPKGRDVFAVIDDGTFGDVENIESDEMFHDVLSRRSRGDVSTSSFLGNYMSKRTKRIGITLLFVIFATFVLRIGFWQVVHGEEYRIIADNNRTRTKVTVPNRGVIFDRYENILAWNTPVFRLVAVRKDIPKDPLDRAIRFVEIGQELGVSSDDFEDRYQKTSPDPTVLLVDDVPYDSALLYIARHGSESTTSMELNSARSYITHAIPTLSHVLGFTGPIAQKDVDSLKDQGYRRFDSIGKQGIEAEYESLLRGTPGVEIVEVNARGESIRTLQKTNVIDGQDIALTIDSGFTAAIEQIIQTHLANASVKRAAVVASNPQNGEVLAIVSYPSYDANLFTRGILQTTYSALLEDENAPLFPRATQGEYPSGSTIKPVYAAAALMEGMISPSTSFLSTGGLWLGNRFFPDWRAGGHGATNVYHAIADSVNTFFYIIGGGNETFEGLGVERLMDYAGIFGFGKVTGIDLPNEATGFLPSKLWKEEVKGEPWFIGDTYNVSIGQGDFLATPLQINQSTSIFAAGGVRYPLHILLGKEVVEEQVVSTEIASVIRDAMRATVTYGSATLMQALSYPVAGKTGTAQWATGRSPHAWFTGFGPFEDPKLSITVIIEEGGDAYYASPIARDIFAWYFLNRVDNILQ